MSVLFIKGVVVFFENRRSSTQVEIKGRHFAGSPFVEFDHLSGFSIVRGRGSAKMKQFVFKLKQNKIRTRARNHTEGSIESSYQ